MEWRRYPLAEIAPASPSGIEFEPGEEVWQLGLEHIESHTGRVTLKLRAPAKAAGNSTFAFDERNVLYSKLRPYLNKVVVPDEPGIATTELVPLRPNERLILREYLGYYLRSPRFLAFASQFVAGAKMPRVIMDKFWAHEAPLPPLSEQRRIVEILDQADRLRRLRAEADAKADRILPALFIKTFGDPATNPMGWPTLSFRELITCGPQNGLYRPASDYGSGTPILRIDSFYAGRITGSANLRRLRVSAAELETYALRPGDIVINRVNSEEFLGKSAIVPELAEVTVFESNMMRLRVDETRVLPDFVIQHLQTAFTRREMLAKAKRAVNQASINQQDVGGLTIIVPPLHEQNRFVAIGGHVRVFMQKANITGDKLDATFRSMLHRAFTGSLTASWREAHMKELLQEMEQQAKALAAV